MNGTGVFQHKKTNRIVKVPFVYNWGQDLFHTTYLGRSFADCDNPYIGPNWKYLGMKELRPELAGVNSAHKMGGL